VNEVCPSCGDFGCGMWKAMEDFPPDTRTHDRRRGKCRTCASAQRQANREANRERENASWRRYYARKVARRLEEAS
jgi:hypothetical protein